MGSTRVYANATEGMMIVWIFAGWTHSHRGIVSNTQHKYIVTGWCSLFLHLKNQGFRI